MRRCCEDNRRVTGGRCVETSLAGGGNKRLAGGKLRHKRRRALVKAGSGRGV